MKRKLFYGLFYMAMLLLLSGVVMLLWNALLPQNTHFIKINYLQALGLLTLSRILCGGFRFRFPWPFRDRNDEHLLKDKLAGMNDEEKASLKEEWRKRCEREEGR